jgi:glycerol-3-phosphate dehydrogenase (NAD(P)+)
LIGQGRAVKEALSDIGMVVEGAATCKAAYELAQSLNVEMPITEQLYRILYEGKEAAAAVNELMLRDKTHESEKLEIM